MITVSVLVGWLIVTGITSAVAGYKLARALHPTPPLREHIIAELENGSGTGLNLADRIERAHGYRPSIGIIYPLLREMEREGVLVCVIEQGGPERRGRQRYVYMVATV